MLSRAVEDSGTVTSPLVPWNSCGAYMAGVLGVATVAYLPFCFFNLLSPVISLFYGFTGIKIEHVEPAAACPVRRGAVRARLRPSSREMRHDGCRSACVRRAEKQARFSLPSAYTILFALIVAGGHRDLDHPRRRVRTRRERAAHPGHVSRRSSRTRSGSSPTRCWRPSTACTGSRARTAASASGTAASCSAPSTSPSSSWSSAGSWASPCRPGRSRAASPGSS